MTIDLSLTNYDLTAERGYLCTFDADQIDLPEAFDAAEDMAAMLPELIVSGRVRHFLKQLSPLDMDEAMEGADEATLRTAFVRYSFMAQAYVWGEAEAPTSIPAGIAVPLCWLADKTGQKPLLTYSSYVLDNWATLDDEAPIGLDNVYMIQNFLSGMDEAWFVLIHVGIEARAGAALAQIPDLITAAARKDDAGMEACLSAMLPVWKDMKAVFDRMPERCDPYMYFNRVRPYIHGWKDNPALPTDGLIYEGVSETPMTFRGQTGSQSSIVPTMDALFGLGHEDDPLRRYLDELHEYRLPAHRRFIDDVRANSTLRQSVMELDTPHLKEAYNAVVSEIAAFRTRHLEYAASYINKQSAGGAGNDTEVGTGGTPFMRYLKKHRDESQEQLLR